MKKNFFIPITFLCFCFASNAYGLERKKRDKPKSSKDSSLQKPAPSNGRGYSIAGAILTPVAASIGGTLFVAGVLNSYGCNAENPTDSMKESCKNSKITMYSGLGLVAFGVGGGIYLTIKGKRIRRAAESVSTKDVEAALNWAMNW